MNRFFRRMQRFGKPKDGGDRRRWTPHAGSVQRRSQGEMANTQAEVFNAHTPQDVTSTRAKGQRHGKVTADKWNQ